MPRRGKIEGAEAENRKEADKLANGENRLVNTEPPCGHPQGTTGLFLKLLLYKYLQGFTILNY